MHLLSAPKMRDLNRGCSPIALVETTANCHANRDPPCHRNRAGDHLCLNRMERRGKRLKKGGMSRLCIGREALPRDLSHSKNG